MRTFVRVDGAACLLLALLILTLPLKWLVAALAAAGIHELCHYLAVMAAGGRVLTLRIGPGGAVMETEPMSRGSELLCALAGPAGSLLLAGLFRFFPCTALCALAQGVFNLLPVYPLDGGRALRCALEGLGPKRAERGSRLVEFGTLGMLGILGIAAIWRHLGYFPLIAALLLAIRRNKPCKLRRFGVQ